MVVNLKKQRSQAIKEAAKVLWEAGLIDLDEMRRVCREERQR